jgi:hypothetical protein
MQPLNMGEKKGSGQGIAGQYLSLATSVYRKELAANAIMHHG